jgi:hypothetical protein
MDGLLDVLDGARRPSLLHTKSDTNVIRLARQRNPLRKDSPPRIIAETHAPSPDADADTGLAPDTGLSPDGHLRRPGLPRSGSSDSATGSSQDLSARSKRHITFNTFVEQCIAIDSPNAKTQKTNPDARWAQFADDEDDDGCVRARLLTRVFLLNVCAQVRRGFGGGLS